MKGALSRLAHSIRLKTPLGRHALLWDDSGTEHFRASVYAIARGGRTTTQQQNAEEAGRDFLSVFHFERAASGASPPRGSSQDPHFTYAARFIARTLLEPFPRGRYDRPSRRRTRFFS